MFQLDVGMGINVTDRLYAHACSCVVGVLVEVECGHLSFL